MRVERLIRGWITSPAALWRRGEESRAPLRFPVPAYLVETASERVLIDTGLNPAAVADPARFYARPEAGLFELECEEPLGEQVDLGSLTRVVISHLHLDHAGSLAALPAGVPIVVQRREWTAAHEPAAIARNFFYPRDYAIDEARLTLVDGDHDLLGDGSVELLLTPGHTPGHQSVRIGERLVLGIDVTHFASTLDDHRFPSFADDYGAQTASAERLARLRDEGAIVVPGHDPELLFPGELEL